MFYFSVVEFVFWLDYLIGYVVRIDGLIILSFYIDWKVKVIVNSWLCFWDFGGIEVLLSIINNNKVFCDYLIGWFYMML